MQNCTEGIGIPGEMRYSVREANEKDGQGELVMRFAVIGTNFITDRLLTAAGEVPGFRLEAVCSRTRERGREYAAKWGAPRVFTDLDELAACPEVDAVYIASPNALHRAQAVKMLRAGKHVLCEKPAASNARELREMYAAADKSGTLLLEAMRPAFLPSLDRLREALPRIGKVRRAVLSFCKYSSRYDRFRAGVIENAFNPALSNGALMDIGVYCVHLLLLLFGEPERIQAACVKLENGLDGAGTILASYGGMTAELLYSKISGMDDRSELQGEDGSIFLGDISRLGDLRLSLRGGGGETPLPVETAGHDMRHELEAFLRMAETGRGEEPHRRRSIAAMELLDEARRQCGIRFPADETR